MKIHKRYLYVLITFFLLGIININKPVLVSNATQAVDTELPQAIQEVESGVVKLLVYAADQKGNEYIVRQGTGILLGTEESEEIVLVNDKLMQADAELMDNIKRQYGLPTEESLTMQIDIVLQVGTRIKTTQGSLGKDFMILNLEKDIKNISCLRLGNSTSVKENDKLYILEYGGNSEILGQSEVSNLDLLKQKVQVTAVTQDEIVTDVQLDNINVGAPVLNMEGDVQGIVAANENGFYIKSIDTIKSVLDVLNISYQRVSTDNHYNEVTDDISNELNKLLIECEELVMKENTYTKKSVKKLKTVISEAISITGNPEATYDNYQDIIDQLNKYKNKLRKKDYSLRVTQMCLCIAIIIFSFLGLRMRMQIRRLQEEGKGYLGANAKENIIVYAKLFRLDNMQEIPITNVIFRIGQDVGDIDYVIENNTSISRHHADIMRKGKEFYILDNNSTNYTFVNEVRAMPGEYVLIKSGDVIRLSNVSFRFEV